MPVARRGQRLAVSLLQYIFCSGRKVPPNAAACARFLRPQETSVPPTTTLRPTRAALCPFSPPAANDF